ncbi:MAG TPA: hypothetical protein VIB82_00385 [Caulobacteraceae bacterium]|jgi:hypothetical protein
MSVIRNFLMVAALASTTAAVAGTSHLTDSQYIAAARCQGLFNSASLGASDSSGINQVMKSEGAVRNSNVWQLGEDARTGALREASHSATAGRSALVSERDGACQAYTHLGGGNAHAAN